MPKYKCIQTVGVAHLIGSYSLPNTEGRITKGQVVELDSEALEKVGAENFVALEETQPEVVVTPETKPEIQPEVVEPIEETGTETQPEVVV